jgi:hypothetical protein
MNVFGYVEGVPLLFKELLCNLSILELCSMLTLCTWCVLIFCYDIFKHLDHFIWYQSIDPSVLLHQGSHLWIFAIKKKSNHFRR